MAGYHDEQENINTAKHIWHSGGKWVAAVLVAGALGYVGYVAYKGRVHQGSAQAAQLAAQVKGDAAKLAALGSSSGRREVMCLVFMHAPRCRAW